MVTTSIARPVSSSAAMHGVACGVAAGALWGLVFLAPQLAREFTPLQLTIGRYFAYGLIASVLMAPRWRALSTHITRREWWHLMGLALAGNTLYYLLLSTAVQTGGIAMTSLVVGFLPVAVTLVGSRDRGAVPLRRLAPSLLLCAVGAICIGAGAFGDSSSPAPKPLLGLLCGTGALLSWTVYAIGNARGLERLPQVSSHDWNLMTGLATGAQSLLLLPLAIVLGAGEHDVDAWTRFACVSIGVATLASIAGNALWNRMSRLLPLTLVGQMILFETAFALLYGWLWETRLPTLLEIAALACVGLGVISCLRAHRDRPTH